MPFGVGSASRLSNVAVVGGGGADGGGEGGGAGMDVMRQKFTSDAFKQAQAERDAVRAERQRQRDLLRDSSDDDDDDATFGSSTFASVSIGV